MFQYLLNTIYKNSKPLIFLSLYAPWMVLWEPTDVIKKLLKKSKRHDNDDFTENAKLNLLIFNNPSVESSYSEQQRKHFILEKCRRLPNDSNTVSGSMSFGYQSYPDHNVNIMNFYHNQDAKHNLENKLKPVCQRIDLDVNSDEENEVILKRDVSEWDLQFPIVTLNEDNFGSELKRKKLSLVLFYAPWCPYCKQIRPIFVKTAEAAKAENWGCTLAVVDCTKSPTIADAYRIDGYPTLYLFKGNKLVKEYNGRRTHEDLKKFIKKNLNV